MKLNILYVLVVALVISNIYFWKKSFALVRIYDDKILAKVEELADGHFPVRVSFFITEDKAVHDVTIKTGEFAKAQDEPMTFEEAQRINAEEDRRQIISNAEAIEFNRKALLNSPDYADDSNALMVTEFGSLIVTVDELRKMRENQNVELSKEDIEFLKSL